MRRIGHCRLIRPVRPRTLEARVFADAAQDDVTASPRDEAEPQSPELTLLPATRIPATGKRVLLVEDNPVNELVARRTLERMGCEVIGAPDGEAAVQFMRRVFANQDAAVEVILMDMHMPRMGGIEAARAIRDMSAGVASTAAAPRQPAIIAVTASAFEEDRQRCLAAGMDDYLAKPFGRAELETCINRWSTSGSDCGPSGQQSKLTGTG